MKKLKIDTSKLIFELKGLKNMWRESNSSLFAAPGKSASLFSSAFEIFYDKDFFYIEAHLWFFGFQIFELVMGKNK